MTDFKWYSDDAGSVVIQEQPITAVYSNPHGQVVLRQKADGNYTDEDTLAYFNPQGALAAAWALIEQAHLVGLPQPSLSLMPVDDAAKPVSLDPGLAAMCQKKPKGSRPGELDQPSLLEAAE